MAKGELSTLHQNELLLERKKLIERIAKSADKIAKLDRLLAVMKSQDLEEDIVHAESEHGIFCIPMEQTVKRSLYKCGDIHA